MRKALLLPALLSLSVTASAQQINASPAYDNVHLERGTNPLEKVKRGISLSTSTASVSTVNYTLVNDANPVVIPLQKTQRNSAAMSSTSLPLIKKSAPISKYSIIQHPTSIKLLGS